MAHRAVDGIMGPRGGGHAQESYEDGAATPASYDGYESQQSYEDGGACGFYQRDFNQVGSFLIKLILTSIHVCIV